MTRHQYQSPDVVHLAKVRVANNNGKITLSYRQAAKRLGVCANFAMRAFHELQAKGFIAVTEKGSLRVVGHARSPRYELAAARLMRKK